MNTSTIESLVSNSTNSTCPNSLLWTPADTDSRSARLYVCIIASFTHSIFWLQLVFCSSVRQKSMQWIYAYLITDILLLFRFFSTYIVHTIFAQCEPSDTWALFVCYYDATVDNYLNILEVYILLALNIGRYIQIVHNKNVYRLHTKLLIATHLAIYLCSLISLVVQFIFGWTQLDMSTKNSCQVIYTNIYVQIFNFLTAFALPIALNILVIYASVRHVRLTSTLQRAAHHVSAREKYHRSLVIQFIVFYTIWVTLWSPNIIVFQVSVDRANLTSYVRLLNFIQIVLDPMIIAALDVRFWQAWKKAWVYLKREILHNRNIQGRIQPTSTNLNAFSLKTPQLRTTAF